MADVAFMEIALFWFDTKLICEIRVLSYICQLQTNNAG
jgi:hypothetical protein